jgi:hypothetical protein
MGTLSITSVAARSGTTNLDTINGGSEPDDWVSWTASTSFGALTDHKLGGGSTISATYYGAATQSNVTSGDGSVQWTDGTTTTSATQTGDVFNSTATTGNGFTVTLPADTNVRTGWILAGPYNSSTDTVVLTLSDGSAGPITNTTSFTATGGTFNPLLLTFSYSANSASQTLTVSIYTQTNGPLITLQAAAVAKVAVPASPIIAWVT